MARIALLLLVAAYCTAFRIFTTPSQAMTLGFLDLAFLWTVGVMYQGLLIAGRGRRAKRQFVAAIAILARLLLMPGIPLVLFMAYVVIPTANGQAQHVLRYLVASAFAVFVVLCTLLLRHAGQRGADTA